MIGSDESVNIVRLPSWLKRPSASSQETYQLKKLLRRTKLNTVCEEARCPNITECFARSTATFMILGDICTRGCRFCAISTGKPVFSQDHFAAEAEHVAQAAETLKLRYVVVTSVARDDLPDGGARGFALTIRALRQRIAGVKVEVLIPDFRGNPAALETVVSEAPDILNHNLETVPRLYRKVRPGALYQRSLSLLQRAKRLRPEIMTKSGIMLGLGESDDEVVKLIADLRAHEVDSFTAGQYLQPTKDHLPVIEFLSPDRFDWYRRHAERAGFRAVAVGPLVRSSYHADKVGY